MKRKNKKTKYIFIDKFAIPVYIIDRLSGNSYTETRRI